MRAVATIRARPTPASQAENARRIRGAGEKLGEEVCRVHVDSAINSESIMLSRQRRAESRWMRWKANPSVPSRKADEKESWVRVIR